MINIIYFYAQLLILGEDNHTFGMEPMGMKFSETVLDRHKYGYDYGHDFRERHHSDRGPDRRGYGYGYRERNYCDVRGRGDGRCNCGCVGKGCRCRRY